MTNIEQLRQEYLQIEIPEDALLNRVQGAVQKSKRQPMLRLVKSVGGGVVAAALIFTVSLNTVEGLAASLQDVPVIGRIATVLTFRTFARSDEQRHYDAEVVVPEISGLENESLQSSLNAGYLEQSEQLYSAFLEEIGAGEGGEVVNRSLAAGYDVAVNDGGLLVIRRYVVETAASAYERVRYDTVDTQNGLLLTLPGLFTDGSYVEVLNKEILRQMEAAMAADESVVYFLQSDETDGFSSIAQDQTFYINEDRQLVIVFDEYQVAPGYMGVCEFVIPTEEIRPILAGNAYVK